MNKLLDVLDFLPGKKTAYASLFTLGALAGNVVGIDVTPDQLMDLVSTLTSEFEVALGAIAVIYGLVMKVIRKIK